MLIKRARIISILAMILMMILPFMPAATSASALQQGVQISHHPLTGMVNFMGAPSTGRAAVRPRPARVASTPHPG